MVTQSANAPAPGHFDAAALPDRAVRAVGGDQVVGADGLLGAAVPGAEDRRDPVVVLLEGDQLGGVGVLSAALLGRPAQQRLQPDLGDEQPRRGAQRLDALVEVPEEELHLRAGQALHRDDGAVLHELLRRRGLDLLLQPHAAEDLHGPLVERGGPGVDRGAAVPLDQQVWHLLRGQQQRRRQPHEAASDDQHGHLAVAHRGFPSRVRRSRTFVPHGGPPTPMGPPSVGGRGCVKGHKGTRIRPRADTDSRPEASPRVGPELRGLRVPQRFPAVC